MSSVIAVCVSLIGLLGVVFTVGIFVQMLLSFPAMLSSNSRAYVQQQRKLYNISPSPSHELLLEEEDFGQAVDAVVAEDSWVDLVDEDTSSFASDAESMEPAAKRAHAGARRLEPITRGRTLRRARRRHSTRTVIRVHDARLLHQDDHQQSHDANTCRDTAMSGREASGRQDCLPGWRTMEWSR